MSTFVRAVLTPSATLLAGVLCVGFGVGSAQAGPSRSVRVTTYQEFAEGEDHGVLITAQGEVRAGIATTRVALPQPTDDSVRASVRAPGGVVYLGTGGDSPSVLVYEKGQLRKLAKLDGSTWVTALCLLDGPGRPAGHLLAATAQDGRLFEISPDGKAVVVAQVEGEHVWALRRDAQRGITYVATGPGKLWAVEDKALDPARKDQSKTPARKLWDSGAKQILALDLVPGDGGRPEGALYVGTADDAVLYRIDAASGAVRALHDFAGNELRAIAHKIPAGGGAPTLVVAVNDMQRGDPSSRGVKLTPAPAGTVPGVKGTSPSGASPPPNQSLVDKKGKGAVFRVDPDGRVEQLHAIVDGFWNDLELDGSGDVYAAASTPGGRGRVYLVKPDRSVLTALEFKESDALTLSLGGAGDGPGPRLVGTGNSGALYVLGDGPPKDAAYLTKVFDGGSWSRWGTLRWSGDGSLRMETRSGNLTKPDSAWSAWQPVTGAQRLPLTGELFGKVASPAGRYLQVRALVGAQAVLRDLTVFFQPLNLRPRVLEVLVGEDPQGRVARAARPATVLRPRSSVVKLRWKVENPDDDDLWYRVYVRPVGSGAAWTAKAAAPAPAAQAPAAAPAAQAAPGAPAAPSASTVPLADASWLRLGGPDPLVRTELEWNTETVADGLYEVKVIVSDERSNAPELAQGHELVSAPFIVDNKKPELQKLRWDEATGMVRGQVVDALSNIGEINYSLDGGDLLPVAAADGVLDDLSEEFSIGPLGASAAPQGSAAPATLSTSAPIAAQRSQRLSPGPHTLVVRAADAADNVSTVQLVIQAK